MAFTSVDELIETEIVNAPDEWTPLETERHSWQWWSKNNKRKLCQKCRIRHPRGGGNYGTCTPCLDGIAAFYEAMGDLDGSCEG